MGTLLLRLAAAQAVGVIVMGIVRLFLVPHLARQVYKPLHKELSTPSQGDNSSSEKLPSERQLDPATQERVEPSVADKECAQERRTSVELSRANEGERLLAAGDRSSGNKTFSEQKGSAEVELAGYQTATSPGQGPLHLETLQVGEPASVEEHGAPDETSVETAERLFLYLQVLTACLKSFAHGANDTANAAGPFAAVQAVYRTGGCDSVTTPFWVLLAMAAGIVLGLATLGYKVMETIGTSLTDINYSKGFAVELGSTLSVVMASMMGAPISSTHCQIGSVVCVGLYESGPGGVDWSVLKSIVVSWLVTIPLAAGAAAFSMWILSAIANTQAGD